jgi:hypothetical protein
MKLSGLVPVISGVILLAGSNYVSRAAPPAENPIPSECSFFGSEREKLAVAALRAAGRYRDHPVSALTGRVQGMMEWARHVPGQEIHTSDRRNAIDPYIFAALQANGITPAPATTDWEFVRRATLDLTGRIPTPTAVLSFVADTNPEKRAQYIEQLLASPQWVDKWTMYFGDLFQNTVTKNSSALTRFAQGRNAFYQYIHDSLAANKPYNRIAAELISAADTDSYTNGPVNWLVGGFISNGPMQDTFDQQTANVADTFLGITYVNCLLCHNGRGHLDQVNLWGSNITRYQGWQLASYLSHSQAARVPVTSGNNHVYYWSLQDNTKGYTLDYALNTTIGNRPARVAPAGCKSGQPCFYVPPQYIFNGDAPKAGETYRAALERAVTADFQFARAAVNYVWAQFFGMGIVDPPDTFDLARLDPQNPPPAGWTLQPTNPALLNALATRFVESGYDLKALMREIANSATYQLSSRYPGQWNDAWEPFFARKYVRRLWSEEIHDAIAQSSGLLPSYNVTGFTDQGYPKVSYAMQLPDVVNAPTGDGNASALLDSFLRGNRDDQPRRQDGSILQALNLMDNPFVEARLQSAGANAAPLIAQNLSLGNNDLVKTLFLNILSRYPTDAELSAVTAPLAAAANRVQAVQNLAWSLYNKVDFVFNY